MAGNITAAPITVGLTMAALIMAGLTGAKALLIISDFWTLPNGGEWLP
jgi:hypothetical protein